MEDKNFKHIVRIANTDLDGNKQIFYALRKIKGVSNMIANALITTSSIARNKKTGTLSDEEIKKLDEILRNPERNRIPIWMFNRRHDPETGEDKHLIGTDIMFNKDNDLKKLKMIRTYKGIRHMSGLPVRGQRTKSNFRRTKSHGKGGSLGVKRRAGAKGGRV